MLYVCTTGDTTHIDTIFKLLPHTSIHLLVSLFQFILFSLFLSFFLITMSVFHANSFFLFPSLLSYLFILSFLLSLYRFLSFPISVSKYHYVFLFVVPQIVSFILFSFIFPLPSFMKMANLGIITMKLFVFFSYIFLFVISESLLPLLYF
jgi:hypothetical protein